MTVLSSDPLARAAAALDASPDYRVLRRLTPAHCVHPGPAEGPLRVGVAVDVETTGLDRDGDRIIELAVQRFRFDARGRIVALGLPRVWREDPQGPLDPRITRLTGLTDADLAGQAIDVAEAVGILTSGDVIIAHNAAFDRPFVDRRLPAIAGRPWACSLAEPDWLELGFDGRALGHLVGQCGWFFEGHRAENDILALIALLGHGLPDAVVPGGGTVLAHLLERSERTSYRVNAIDAPFEAKDALKARGYRWDAALRFWWTTVAEDAVEAERTWLLAEAYRGGHAAPAFLPQTACDRYR